MRTKNIFPTAFLFLLLASGSLFGCARMSIDMVGAPMVSAMINNITETKSVRLAKEGLAGQVLMITALTEMSPDNLRLLKECAFIYCAYGLFVEDEDPEYAKELYSIGKEYGIRALKQNSEFREALESGKRLSEIAGIPGNEYTEILCWTAMNGGLLIMLNLDDPEALMDMEDIVALMKRSLDLDDTYYFGTGKIFMAAYYAMMPSYMGLGGGVKNSKALFHDARSITNGRFLLADLFEARFLAVSIDDEEFFENKINDVLSADSHALKEAGLINELSKLKARYYLDHIDKYF